MAKAKHTPGPWTNEYGNGISGPTTPTIQGPTCDEFLEWEAWIENNCEGKQPENKHTVVSKDTTTIAIITNAECGPETMEANARLIAAAPDLFKELKESTNMFEILVGEDWLSTTVKNFLVEQIKGNKAVIEKATAE